ncbi:MAG: hypothetical protein ACI8Z1_000230 [Candidatus Azotimanducaceae bacterium]|jgi:uncharacterized protein (DUF2235 family)
MSSRNLVVLFDGTWNDAASRTNLKKLYRVCSRSKQVFHYEEGVGTAFLEAVPGGVYGKHLDRQILGAYRFLRRRFQDKDWQSKDLTVEHSPKNKVFLFGFSRGSYAARRTAGLINFCGLPVKAADVELAWQLYLSQDSKSVAALLTSGRLIKIPIEVVGVWDTVKTTTDSDFNDNILPGCVKFGYQAMAIDEKRKAFKVLKWRSDKRIRQVWFTGVHSDVGGGYPVHSLSDIALKWMADSTLAHGLRLKGSEMGKLKPDPMGELHDSFQGIWKPLGTRVRSISPSSLVHASVKERMDNSDYVAPNLPANPEFVSL